MGLFSPRVTASTLAFLTLFTTAPAFAGGMEIPENGTIALSRGGAYTVLANDLTAIALNPGALTRRRGTSMYIGNTFTFSTLKFTRAESFIPEEPIAAMYNLNRTGTSSNKKTMFPLGCFIGVATDFGLEDWRFGFGAYGPSASGAQSWPKDGSQRYMLTEMEALAFYLDATVAYGKPDHFGVGLSLQLALTPSIAFSVIVDGALGGQLNPYASSTDLEATLKMTAPPTVSAIVGAWWRVIPQLELAVAGRLIPVYLRGKGKITLANVPNTCPEGDDSCLAQTTFTDEELRITDSVARLNMLLPPTARFGIRYRHLEGEFERFDIEMNVVYEAWSMVKSFDLDLDGYIHLANVESPDVSLQKRWRDTISVRLGSSINIIPELTVSLGSYYETGSVPEGYESLDFLSFDRVGLTFGLSTQLGPVRISAGYSHVWQEDRRVSELEGKYYQLRPLDPCPESCDDGAGWSGVPVNAGLFQTSYDMLSAAVDVQF